MLASGWVGIPCACVSVCRQRNRSLLRVLCTLTDEAKSDEAGGDEAGGEEGGEGSTAKPAAAKDAIPAGKVKLANGALCLDTLGQNRDFTPQQVEAAVAWAKRFPAPMNVSEQALYIVKYKKHVQDLADAAARAAEEAEKAAAAAAAAGSVTTVTA